MKNYGSLESIYPAVWNHGDMDGYVLFSEAKGWRKKSVAEIEHTVAAMTKAEFDKAFPNLPPLPR